MAVWQRMKTTATFLLFLTAGSLLPLSAQDKTTPPKDPFVKGKPDEPEPKAMPPEEKRNVLCLLETITLPMADYAAWLDAPSGREKLYEMAQAAVKNGSAKLDGCHYLANQHGMRGTVSGVDEVMYPTEWTPADSTGFQYPTAFENHRVGHQLESECMLAPGQGGGGVTSLFYRDHFEGFRAWKADGSLAGIPVADFTDQVGGGLYKMVSGVPQLMSTLKSSPDSITLVFNTFHVVGFPTPPKPAAKGVGNLQVTARVISLERMKGCELLKKHRLDDAACLAELKTMIAGKEASLEHLSTLVTAPAVAARYECGPQYTYGTGYLPPAANVEAGSDGAKAAHRATAPGGAASTKSTEMRRLGMRWAVECNVDEERQLANSSLSFSNTRMSGMLKDKLWPEHCPELPLFSEEQVTTAVLQPLNSTVLVGSLNPAGDTGANGHQDDGKLWLVFLDIDQE